MGVIVAILAIIANTSLAASAVDFDEDAARTGVSALDILAGANTWSNEMAGDEMVGAEVGGGCEFYAVMYLYIALLDLAM